MIDCASCITCSHDLNVSEVLHVPCVWIELYKQMWLFLLFSMREALVKIKDASVVNSWVEYWCLKQQIDR